MSLPGCPNGEYRTAQHAGFLMSRVTLRSRRGAMPPTSHRAGLVLAAALCLATPTGRAAEPGEPVHLHSMARGDTLIGLGRRYLVDAQAWPEIAQFNGVRDARRMAIGSVVRIPLRLMQIESVSASVLAVVGDVRAGTSGQALRPGAGVAEADEVRTGDDGTVTLRLVDGTLLRLRARSQMRLSQSRRVPAADAVRSAVQLDSGRVEVESPRAGGGRPGFEVRTPQGVLGVRGTEFRVAADTQAVVTRAEVLEGVVGASGTAVAAEQRLQAGYGTLINAQQGVAPPRRLLAAPDVSALPALQDRLLVRFVLPALEGARGYRAQVALDAGFDQVLADLVSLTPELRIADLPDGDYLIRVRAVDELGLEGSHGQHRFRLKARPVPPLPTLPAPRAVIVGDRLELAWTGLDEAASYHLQIAKDSAFTQIVAQQRELRALSTTVERLPFGSYFWRIGSVRANADAGPFGDPRSFELRMPPPQPRPPSAKVSDAGVSLSWEGTPGQQFDFQVARDAEFRELLYERRLSEPAISYAPPGPGRYYVRLRTRESDGFVGPFSTPQRFEIPNCVRTGAGGCLLSGDGTPLLSP